MRESKIPVGWLLPLIGIILAIGIFLGRLGWGVDKVSIPPVEIAPPEDGSTPSRQTTQQPLAPVVTISPSCAFVTRSQVEELKTIQDVVSAIRMAEEFAGYRQNDYRRGETIPAGVLIATDLHSADFGRFGVIPINNQGGWGLFVTTREFQAPNDGTYWCIQE